MGHSPSHSSRQEQLGLGTGWWLVGLVLSCSAAGSAQGAERSLFLANAVPYL